MQVNIWVYEEFTYISEYKKNCAQAFKIFRSVHSIKDALLVFLLAAVFD